jgi:uncharacterized protein
MEMTGERVLPVDQATAWQALNDPSVLQVCLPGCDAIIPTGQNAYDVSMTAAVGPVKAKFKGKLTLANVTAPHSYDLLFEGQGGMAGFAKGSAHVTLTPQVEGTLLAYTAHANVGGKIAQVGSRLIDSAARKLADAFFEKFQAQVGGGAKLSDA